MGKTKIEWCDFTFNCWLGCTKVSAGCDNCYAEAMMDKRWGKVEWGPHGERKRTSADYWNKPRQWDRAAQQEQRAWEELPPIDRSPMRPGRPRVFCASLADVFDNQVPWEWRLDLFNLIMATPELDWLLLTKRPENIEKLRGVPMQLPMNVWLGTTCEDQAAFDRRWPILSKIPAAVRFVSYEPAIGPLRLFGKDGPVEGLSWLICGGESGQGYRWMEPAWERDVRLDCGRLGVAYFFKQMAGKKPIPPEMLVRQFPR